ncbi:unnamed protein product [Prunus armeniaca]|uniref:Uncharacterized protein n=1 Tax=Prunus armeniaca TaxID=36596 RepID=A0A6J5XEP4_PRUAR|nr:unnamed protein product [Prunus armeniaca]
MLYKAVLNLPCLPSDYFTLRNHPNYIIVPTHLNHYPVGYTPSSLDFLKYNRNIDVHPISRWTIAQTYLAINDLVPNFLPCLFEVTQSSLNFLKYNRNIDAHPISRWTIAQIDLAINDLVPNFLPCLFEVTQSSLDFLKYNRNIDVHPVTQSSLDFLKYNRNIDAHPVAQTHVIIIHGYSDTGKW